MAVVNTTGTKGFEANAALGQHILVKQETSGKLSVAALGEEFVGTTLQEAFAQNDVISVRLKSAPGTMKCVASGAFAINAVVYGRAAGKIDDISTTSAIRVGIALEAAAAAGNVVEVMQD